MNKSEIENNRLEAVLQKTMLQLREAKALRVGN